MECKKYPLVNPHRNWAIKFPIGLLFSLTLVICAFEWKTPSLPLPIILDNSSDDDGLALILPPIPEPPRPEEVKPIPKPTSNPTPTTEPIIDKLPLPKPMSEVRKPIAVLGPTVSLPVPKPGNTAIDYAEEMPVPLGGEEALYAYMRKEMKYPSKAVRMGVEGVVYVQFVVDRDGSVSDLEVLRGIGFGCDEEAMRIIARTQWKPGKQGGSPVKVRMVFPIRFVLEKN